MLPNKTNKITDVSHTSTIEYSRAHTFLDSYIYMKNGKYNAMYQKNKEMLAIEKLAIERESAEGLFAAATEQMQALNSVIVRIRDFSQEVRRDVIQNLKLIIPDAGEIRDFEEAINGIGFIPRLKVLKYEIKPITYPNMSVFYNLFRNELKEFTKINDETGSIDNPFIHKFATNYLIDANKAFSNDDFDILEKESMELTTKQELVRILNYFKRKDSILNIVVKDFRTFYIYIRAFKTLDNINDLMRPTVLSDGQIEIGTGYLQNFNDYLTLYKHYTMMLKYLIDTVSNFNTKFFNKIYSIQSNIECYRTIMNNVISIYKTRVRNMDESFDGGIISPFITGPETATDMLNDEADPTEAEDRIDGINNINNDITDDNMDLFNKEYETNVDINQLMEKLKDNQSYVYCPSYSIRKYINPCTDLYKIESAMQEMYENVSPMYLSKNKLSVLTEAETIQNNYKAILTGLLESIVSANNKFKDGASDIHSKFGDIHEVSKKIDIQSYDLSGIDFEIYNIPKGVDFMHRIRIPSFRENDINILLTDNGIEYKRKYFPKAYYFNQNGCPIDATKFKGSLSKKTVQEYGIAKLFAWSINFIETYDDVINAVSHANSRIKAAINRGISIFDYAYGGSNKDLVEAILLNRSQFRNDIFDVLLEDNQDPQQQPQNTNPPEQLNPDDAAAKQANDNDFMYKAIIKYVKIAYEVNSFRMLYYENALEDAFEFLDIINHAINK